MKIPDERLDLTRRKRSRVDDYDSAIAADVKRIRQSTEDVTGIYHRFTTLALHSEGGDFPISEFNRDMPDPGIFILSVASQLAAA